MENAHAARAAVFSSDAEFARMLCLYLRERGYDAVPYTAYLATDAAYAVFDLDSVPPPIGVLPYTVAVGFSRREREERRFPVLLRPFTYAALLSALTGDVGDSPYTVDRDRRRVLFSGGEACLSKTELCLFLLLLSHIGEAVPAELLLREALPNGDRGTLAVYICYLRRKLERDGARRILSSRGGYLLKP